MHEEFALPGCSSSITGVFSSREIRRPPPPDGPVRLEARCTIDLPPFAGSWASQSGSDVPLREIRVSPEASQPRAPRRPAAAAPKSPPVLVVARPAADLLPTEAWTFTYANGTFSAAASSSARLSDGKALPRARYGTKPPFGQRPAPALLRAA